MGFQYYWNSIWCAVVSPAQRLKARAHHPMVQRRRRFVKNHECRYNAVVRPAPSACPGMKENRMTPFQSPAFRRLWCSSLASTGAQGMERTVTAWLALETGGGAFVIGLIFAARMLPSLLFGLAAGTIADRADRPRQLLTVGGAALLLMATFSWLIGTGGIRVWQVVA